SGPLRKERELRVVTEGGDDERAIQVAIEALARRLGHEQAAVACRAFEVARRVIGWPMMRAHGVVRAERANVPRSPEMAADGTPLLDEATERAFGAARSGEDEEPCHGQRIVRGRAVDALAERRRRVAALERDARHQEMCERVEQIEARPGKIRR